MKVLWREGLPDIARIRAAGGAAGKGPRAFNARVETLLSRASPEPRVPGSNGGQSSSGRSVRHAPSSSINTAAWHPLSFLGKNLLPHRRLRPKL
jgi:hypothetical protein